MTTRYQVNITIDLWKDYQSSLIHLVYLVMILLNKMEIFQIYKVDLVKKDPNNDKANTIRYFSVHLKVIRTHYQV